MRRLHEQPDTSSRGSQPRETERGPVARGEPTTADGPELLPGAGVGRSALDEPTRVEQRHREGSTHAGSDGRPDRIADRDDGGNPDADAGSQTAGDRGEPFRVHGYVQVRCGDN